MERGLRASLKTGNLVTGALYVDMDFYPKAPPITGIREFGGYKIIPTVSGGLAQIQQRLMETLDKINNLPLNPMIEAGDRVNACMKVSRRCNACKPRWITSTRSRPARACSSCRRTCRKRCVS